MEENYGFGYRAFDSFARFVDRHTPNPIRNMAKKFNNKPIEKMKYLTYGGLTLTGGISVYGFWTEKPEWLAAGLVTTLMVGTTEFVRGKVKRSISKLEEQTRSEPDKT
ncbi:hypothetical protein J4422_02925 [Candidatus Pacearchaeota archaeon]|nr:hypothetical protein [Candidatus Pacearchaeota archaeon]